MLKTGGDRYENKTARRIGIVGISARYLSDRCFDGSAYVVCTSKNRDNGR